MRSILLLSSLLILSACSDSSNQTTSKTPKENTVAQKTTQTTKETTLPTVQVKKNAPSGHSLYAHKCASCHGLKAQKMALNKSQVIAGWDAKKTTEVLKGYQSGVYGSNMKGIMKGQVSTLDDKEIGLLSAYIASL